MPQNFLYQEKEWQQDLSLNLYDFEWRQYDPFTARTTTMDPHADSYQDLSPYSWAANNPVSIIDPDGQDIINTAIGTTYTGADAQDMFRQLQSQSSTPRSQSQSEPLPNYSGTFSEGMSRHRNAQRQNPEIAEPAGSGKIRIFGTDAPAPKPLEKPVNALAWLIGNALDGVINFVSDISKNDIGLSPNPLGTVTNGVGQGFRSFSAFKRARGAAGTGMAWHHIVEQNPSNLAKFGAGKIHNLNNVLKLPHGAGSIHARISGFYSSRQNISGGKVVREWLKTQTFQEQYDFGIKILKQFGWKP